jgi:8-oxo-dGTP pyrophosphatase MutT (NUDIX family)
MFEWFSSAIEAEFQELAIRFGAPLATSVAGSFTGAMQADAVGQRQGEVCMVVRRPNGLLLTMTKTFYPQGIFRLPTGGIEAGEGIFAALLRETHEETGLDVQVARFLVALNYLHGDVPFFASFAFLLDEAGGTLGAVDPHEHLLAFREVAVADLPTLADQMDALSDGYSADLDMRWRDWGQQRAALQRLVWQALSQHEQ